MMYFLIYLILQGFTVLAAWKRLLCIQALIPWGFPLDFDARIEDVMLDWYRDGKSKIEDLADVEDDKWDSLIEKTLQDVEGDMAKFPERAFSKMMNFLNFMESAARSLPHIARIVAAYIGRIRKILGSIAKFLGASSFSISIGTPFYLNFSMNFNE